MFQGKQITIFGGSGFIGRNIVRELAQKGARIAVACRDVEAAKFLKVQGVVGQVTPVHVDVTEGLSAIAPAVEGADMVINLCGILFESGRNRFDAVQGTAPGLIASAAAKAGAGKFLHVSAIGADANSASRYARSKAAGEDAVRAAFPSATILRPSVVFGPDDDFFNRFGAMAESFPFLPLIGGGTTKFQPVYVDDVADAALKALATDEAAGKTYELGGPKIYTFRELMEMVNAQTGRARRLVDIPFWAASIEAAFLEWLPTPPLTRDQVTLLKSDNVVSEGALTLTDLGVTPTACEAILPTYLDRFRTGGRYNRFRAA
ncbi:MAG: complex I NDUFA9 subunit family protein [Nisaea sp.]|jgi:NADH dehydrogenase|uniref:complex I NDUFA9 subunit family protein n=1 Tax=Nisaea sp. TaxID=2024842 RepID=UPI001B258F53|nr:complex I NDUFA9 subunit family protein [Nisaea sp.]MBO6560439.1 complex I NDUFA9 subunit family protein [Nisaea sp.]